MQDQNPYAAPVAQVSDLAAGGPELASLGARLGGFVIDFVLYIIIVTCVTFLMGGFSMVMSGQPPAFGQTALWTLISFVIYAAIQFVPLQANGQSWGKKIVGTKIVTLDGQKPDIIKLIPVRYGCTQLIGIIPFVGFVINLVGVLLVFREDRRCLHDLIAGTRVVVAK